MVVVFVQVQLVSFSPKPLGNIPGSALARGHGTRVGHHVAWRIFDKNGMENSESLLVEA